MKIIIIGGALLLLLPVAHALAPSFFYFLPLGGSAIAEIGIVLGACVAIETLAEALWRKSNEGTNNDNSGS